MINIVTALACEANPIIQHYRLKKEKQNYAFPIYTNDTITLIISGIGRTTAACAVGYMQALHNTTEPLAWFNVGIAGHKTRELGEGFLAHRITDAASGQRFYPFFTFDTPCITDEVISVDQAETEYADNAAYDMEAAGFYTAAMRFSTCELVHSFKVISDNLQESSANVTKQLGEQLIGNHLSLIDDVVKTIQQLQLTTTKMFHLPKDYQALLALFRFSVTQQNQLKQIMLRWHALKMKSVFECVDITGFDQSRQVLAAIESELKSEIYNV